MYQLIQSAFRTSTFRQTLITIISTFVSAGLGAVFYLLLARLMDPADYGLFTLATTSAMLAVSLADLGAGQSVVRFIGQNRKNHHYFPFALLALRLKIFAGAVCLISFTFLARPLALHALRQPALTSLMPLVGLGALALLLISFPADIGRGLQQFYLWGGVQISSNIFRLFLLAILAFASLITARNSLLIFAIAPIVTFLVAWKWVDIRLLRSHVTREHLRQFWAFNKWTAAVIIAVSVTSRLDTFVTARYLSLSDLGIYGLANTMAFFMPQLSGALGAVTSAKFASFSDPQHAAKYLKKALLFTVGISLLVAVAMIPTALAVVWFAGPAYATALAPFFVLLMALAIFTSFNPIRDSIFYFHARPDFFFWITLFQAALVVLSGALLIPRFGVVGSASTVFISHTFLALTSSLYYLKLIRSVPG